MRILRSAPSPARRSRSSTAMPTVLIAEHRPTLAGRVAFVTADLIQPGVPRERFRLVDRPVFVKPFDLAELDRCVERWVEPGPRAAALPARPGRGGGTRGGVARMA